MSDRTGSATSDDKPDTATPAAASQPLNAVTNPSCLPTGCCLYPCRDNSAANPATNGPSGPGPGGTWPRQSTV